ncbi:hypothetical protein Dsin_028741 [Dipteronia sinensis]|uniref:DNA/RNA-binding protein Kin17 WH-like domain-containing protein n=1 Tax=Dipteronia sinensis TaxID=43782 RepID=A0AAD9ZR43_9ROSI|nr:hypothetical protein Dsin_028741 [Dipteronia sinensis]
MNSTKWSTLTEFIKHLGRAGKCKVEETPKGWFITYIDRDSETLFKEKLKNKRIKLDLVEEEKQEKEIRKQIEMVAADHLSSESDNNPPTDFNLEAAAGLKIGFSLASSLVNKDNHATTPNTSSKFVFEELDNNSNKKIDKASGGKSALEELMREEEKVKQKMNRKDYWLCEGIIVKVMSKRQAFGWQRLL